MSKKKRCSKCSTPLNLHVSQLLGKKNYIIVDIEDLKFLIKNVKRFISSESSYKFAQLKKIEKKYKMPKY